MDVYKALAHSERREILTMLSCGNLKSSEIKKHMNFSDSAISTNIKILVNTKLVNRRKNKRFRIYSINLVEIKKIIKFLDRLL